jgi:hypothetical protein
MTDRPLGCQAISATCLLEPFFPFNFKTNILKRIFIVDLKCGIFYLGMPSSTLSREVGPFVFSDSFEFLKSVSEQRDLELSICRDLQILISDKIITPCKQILDNQPSQLQNRTTVGLTLKGATIAGIIIGGPAFMSGQLNIGDVIVMVDRRVVTSENLHDLLVGSDEPGSTVTITVIKDAKSSDIFSSTLSDTSSKDEISVELDRVRVEEIFDHRYLQTKLEFLLVL